jgi:putative oxidoreductase
MDGFQEMFVMIGRVIMGAMFLWGAVEMFMNWKAMEQHFKSNGVPQADKVLMLFAALRVLGGVSFVLGMLVPLGALLLLITVVPAAVKFHAFWAAQGEKRLELRIKFMAAVTVCGALIVMMGY